MSYAPYSPYSPYSLIDHITTVYFIVLFPLFLGISTNIYNVVFRQSPLIAPYSLTILLISLLYFLIPLIPGNKHKSKKVMFYIRHHMQGRASGWERVNWTYLPISFHSPFLSQTPVNHFPPRRSLLMAKIVWRSIE